MAFDETVFVVDGAVALRQWQDGGFDAIESIVFVGGYFIVGVLYCGASSQVIVTVFGNSAIRFFDNSQLTEIVIKVFGWMEVFVDDLGEAVVVIVDHFYLFACLILRGDVAIVFVVDVAGGMSECIGDFYQVLAVVVF